MLTVYQYVYTKICIINKKNIVPASFKIQKTTDNKLNFQLPVSYQLMPITKEIDQEKQL